MLKVATDFKFVIGDYVRISEVSTLSYWPKNAVARVEELVLRITKDGPTRFYVLSGSREEVPVRWCERWYS